MDFWDPEIMKIVILLKRGLDFAFFEIFEKNRKMQKGTPKSMFLAQKFARGPLAPERGVLSSGAESVCVYVFHSMIFSFVFIFLVQNPFAIILFFYRIES